MSRFASLRIRLNLAVFALVGVLLAYWALTTVIHLDRFERPSSVTVDFATSPGLSPRFEVTYLGHAIGSIRSVELVDGHVTVDLRIDRDVELPAAIDAAVRRKSAVGEPYVDLFPTRGTDPNTGPRLASGAHIPLERTTTPLAYDDLFSAADRLLDAVGPADLRTVLTELANAVDGRGESLRTIFTSTHELVGTLAENADLLDAVLRDLTLLTTTVAEHSGSLGAGIDDLATISQTLAASQADLAAVLDTSPSFVEALAGVLETSAADLGCSIDGLGDVATRLDPQTLGSLHEVLALSPQFLYVLDGLTNANGDVGGSLFFTSDNAAPLPLYETPLEPPVVPADRSCAEDEPGGTSAPEADPNAPPGGPQLPATDTGPSSPPDGGPSGDASALPDSSDQPGRSSPDPWSWLRLLLIAIVLAIGAWAARRLIAARRREEPTL